MGWGEEGRGRELDLRKNGGAETSKSPSFHKSNEKNRQKLAESAFRNSGN